MGIIFVVLSVILLAGAEAVGGTESTTISKHSQQGYSLNRKHRYKSHVSWINGIAHTPEDAKKTAEEIASLFGGSCIHYCHNPTSMRKPSDTVGYVKDLTQCTQQLQFGKETKEVLDLREHLKKLCKRTGRYGKVVHLAHSQGALITYLAAKELTDEERRKIEVICFGGAAAITREEFPEFSRCINYYSINDPLLHIVERSKRALSTGLLGWNVNSGEPEFVFLTPKGNDPIVDHGLLGPTYRDLVSWEGNRFLGTYWGGRVKGFEFLVLIQKGMDGVCRWLIRNIVVRIFVWLKMVQSALVGMGEALGIRWKKEGKGVEGTVKIEGK